MKIRSFFVLVMFILLSACNIGAPIPVEVTVTEKPCIEVIDTRNAKNIPFTSVIKSIDAIGDYPFIGEPDILNFHEQMLESVKKYGRTHKLEIMMRYKLKKKDFFQDIGLGLTMLAKRKLDLRAKKVKDKQSIENIFKK